MTALPRAVQGLLFDLDGTLVSTKEANYCAYRDAFEAFGHVFPVEVFETTWGRDSRDFIPDVLPGIAPSAVDAVRAHKSAVYERYLDRTVPNTALIEFLRLLAPSHKTALVSTAKSANGRQILAVHGLEDLFDVVVFGDAVERSKPDPEGYNKALAGLGLPPDRCIAFEDSPTGRLAAMAAGLLVMEVPEF